MKNWPRNSELSTKREYLPSTLATFAFGVLSVFVLSQTPSFAQATSLLSSALECRSIGIPTNKPWNTFSEGDLPVSSLLAGQENLIKSFQKSQGEDGNSSTIKFKKPEKAFGLNVSTVILSTDIFGVQQLSLIDSANIEQLKNVIEKELSIKFNFADEQYIFFNPTSGIEYKISKDAASPKGYFFACGLNSQLYEEVVQKEESERAEKAKIAQQERDKVEKEKYNKQIEGYLAQNNKVFREYINDVEMAEVYAPAIGAGVGLILVLLGGLFLYLRSQSEGGKSKTMLVLSASTGSVGVVFIALGAIQFLHPVYKVESAKVEQAWKDTAEHVLNNEKYIKTYMKAGETLAKDGSMDVAAMLASYYVGGTGKVAADSGKAKHFSSLSTLDDVQVPTDKTPIVDSKSKSNADDDVSLFKRLKNAISFSSWSDGSELNVIWDAYLKAGNNPAGTEYNVHSKEYLLKGTVIGSNANYTANIAKYTNSISMVIAGHRVPPTEEVICVSYFAEGANIKDGMGQVGWRGCNDIKGLISRFGGKYVPDREYAAKYEEIMNGK